MAAAISPRTLTVLATVLAAACIESPTQSQPTKAEPTVKPALGAPAFDAVGADARPVPEIVGEATRTAKERNERLIVYVGATWCEPCTRFHEAVEAGELNENLAGVRFLEFDADEHGEDLKGAGYGGRLIPRFAIPGQDGRGTGVKVEGGVKGERAVEHIMARLGPMLAGPLDPL